MMGGIAPDVVVMDISMPGIGGLEAINRILAKQPATRILVLSAHEDTMHPKRVLKAGAFGYLSKRSAPEELIKAIRLVAKGKTYLEPAIAQQVALQEMTGDRNPVEVLSDKEFKVFLALARGQSVNEDRRSDVAQPAHGRDASLQHQAEAAGGQLGRIGDYRNAQWIDGALGTTCTRHASLS